MLARLWGARAIDSTGMESGGLSKVMCGCCAEISDYRWAGDRAGSYDHQEQDVLTAKMPPEIILVADCGPEGRVAGQNGDVMARQVASDLYEEFVLNVHGE